MGKKNGEPLRGFVLLLIQSKHRIGYLPLNLEREENQSVRHGEEERNPFLDTFVVYLQTAFAS